MTLVGILSIGAFLKIRQGPVSRTHLFHLVIPSKSHLCFIPGPEPDLEAGLILLSVLHSLELLCALVIIAGRLGHHRQRDGVSGPATCNQREAVYTGRHEASFGPELAVGKSAVFTFPACMSMLQELCALKVAEPHWVPGWSLLSECLIFDLNIRSVLVQHSPSIRPCEACQSLRMCWGKKVRSSCTLIGND